MIGSRQQRHIDILVRNVLHRLVVRLAERQCVMRVGEDAPGYRNCDAAAVALDGDWMTLIWDFDRLRG